MEISLRLDTLGIVETQYLRARERYRDWPHFQLLAASRQARVFAYLTREVAEQLHQQILMIETALGLDLQSQEEGSDEEHEDEEHEDEEEAHDPEDSGKKETTKALERSTGEPSAFSPAFAQALKQLNELARQRLPEASSGGNQVSGTLSSVDDSEDDALEQLQDAFVQMMEVVRELAEEMATDALKVTGRLKCARTNIEFVPRPADSEEDDDEDDEDLEISGEGVVDLEVELIMVLQLFEEGRARPEDPPAVELQLDVDDFERLHETLDFALERERRSRRRRG